MMGYMARGKYPTTSQDHHIVADKAEVVQGEITTNEYSCAREMKYWRRYHFLMVAVMN